MTFNISWCHNVIPMPYSYPRIHRHSWKPCPCWHHSLGPCRCHGVYYSSWEGLLRVVFASWVKCVDMKYDKYTHFARNLCHVFSRRIKASRLLGVDSAQMCSILKFPRPLDATVEDAETQLCQIVDGFLGTNSSVKNPGCFCVIFSWYMWFIVILSIDDTGIAQPRSMAWQSPHVQRSSAVESFWPTAADRCSAGKLCLDELLDAAACWGGGAHRANGGPWHQHLDQLVKHGQTVRLDRSWHITWEIWAELDICMVWLRCSSVAFAAGLCEDSYWPLVWNIQPEWDIHPGSAADIRWVPGHVAMLAI